jgi:hypothetical protein
MRISWMPPAAPVAIDITGFHGQPTAGAPSQREGDGGERTARQTRRATLADRGNQATGLLDGPMGFIGLGIRAEPEHEARLERRVSRGSETVPPALIGPEGGSTQYR